MTGNEKDLIAAVRDLARMLEAVRYTVGLGDKQMVRIEHALAVAARIEKGGDA